MRAIKFNVVGGELMVSSKHHIWKQAT